MKARILLALLIYLAPVALYLGRWSAAPVGLDAVSAVTPGHVAVVGALRADDPALEAPAAAAAALTAAQVADLVRKTAYYSGGLSKALDPGAGWIVVKPGALAAGDALEAHALVVQAVLRLIHEAAPQARISVVAGLPGGEALDARLARVLKAPELAGARVDRLDLKAEEYEEMEVPDGGEGADAYPVPIALLECDAVIDVACPAAGAAGAMANLAGLARTETPPGRLPAAVLVDLALLSEVDFAVLDLTFAPGPEGRRLNTVLAGRDLVAIDRVAAALPQAGAGGIDALVLASARGLGQVNLGDIKVNGIAVAGTWVEPPADAGSGK
ncbi:MAG: DUF362 domain-containing protein [Gemmatimonadota bacterium]